MMGFRGGMAAAAKNLIAVLEDKSQRSDYLVTTFTGERRTLHEAWRYNFFTSRGSFSAPTAGGSDILGRDDGEDGGTATIWIVVRDGRGGEAWTARQAVAP